MRAWRESASLILAARNGKLCANNAAPAINYKLMCLKRSQNSSFMPGTYVFPGGTIHSADTDMKWKSLFSNFGFDNNNFNALLPDTKTRPMIFSAGPNELPKEISLRITAIRETFEECGVLLCKQERDSSDAADWATHLPVSENELHTWMSRVHKDANQFFALCEEFKCYPDLWSLHEWNNWLTPTYISGKRFDTIFFLVCMPSTPEATYEAIEMEDLKWDTPMNLLTPSPENIVLPPPQHYEIARVAKFETIEELLKFAVDRKPKGTYLNLPVMVQLRDGIVHVLPGDSMYPETTSLTDVQIIDKTDMTLSEFRDMSPIKNRIEYFSRSLKRLMVENFESSDGHLSPIESQTRRISLENKL